MAWLGKPSTRDDLRAEAFKLWLGRQHPLAIVSAMLGTISLLDLGVLIVPQLAGLVTGILALVQLKRIAGRPLPVARSHGHGLAWTGIALSAVSLVIAACVYFWYPTHGRGS